MVPYIWKQRVDLDPLGMLGSGSFGEVWKTRCLTDFAFYAVKIIGVDAALHKLGGRIKKLTSEVEILLKLFHPNVVRYHTSWYEGDAIDIQDKKFRIPEDYELPEPDSIKRFYEFSNNYLYIQMEFCEQTLSSWMRAHPEFKQRETELMNICLCLTAGLQHVHDLNLVHRDIKPDNIFGKQIQSKGEICWEIGDFGLAKEESDDISTQGNRVYRSPDSTLSCKSDVWSLGKVLLNLFPAGNAPLSQEFGKLKEVIEKRMLETVPQHRTSAGEANVMFAEIFTGKAIQLSTQMKPLLAVNPFIFDLRLPVKSAEGSRKVQLETLNQLSEFETKFHFLTIIGMGGVGKTELVKLYLAQPNLKHTRNLIWLQGDNECNFSRNLQTLKCSLNAGSSKVVDIISKLAPIDTIFVIDNVAELSGSVDEFLRGFHLIHCSGLAKILVIVTTRVVEVMETLGGSEVRLGVLEEDDAVRLVAESLQIPISSESSSSIQSLCSALQNLPLAIQQASSFILQRRKTRKNYSTDDYLQRFKDAKKELLRYKLPRQFHEYEETTLTTWDINFRQIKEDPEFGKEAGEILNLMAYLMNPDGEEAHFVVDFFELLLRLQLSKENIQGPINNASLTHPNPTFLEIWDTKDISTVFSPRGETLSDYLGQQTDTKEFYVDEATEIAASCIRLIQGFSLCSFDLRRNGKEFISIHRLVAEIIRIHSEDAERAANYPWLSTLYQKLLQPKFRVWSIKSLRRFKVGRETAVENLWNLTPTEHKHCIVEEITKFFEHIWLDAKQGFLTSVSLAFLGQVIHTNNFPTEKQSGLIFQKYFWHRTLQGSDGYYPSVHARMENLKKQEGTFKKFATSSESEGILAYFLKVNNLLPFLHPLREDAICLGLMYVHFYKLPANTPETMAYRLAAVTQLFSSMFSYAHQVNLTVEEELVVVDHSLRIVGQIFEILQNLPEENTQRAFDELKDVINGICKINDPFCSRHKTLLLSLLGNNDETDKSDLKICFEMLSNINYTHYPIYPTIFVLNFIIENFIIERETGDSFHFIKISGMLDSFLENERKDLLYHYCCALLKIVPNIVSVESTIMADTIINAVSRMEKKLWQQKDYVLCVKISINLIPLLNLREKFPVPDIVPTWMDDIVARSSTLGFDDIQLIQAELNRSTQALCTTNLKPSGLEENHLSELPKILGIQGAYHADNELPFHNKTFAIACLPDPVALSRVALEDNNSLVSYLAWGLDMHRFWEEEKDTEWFERCRSFSIQLAEHPLRQYFEYKISTEVAKSLFSSNLHTKLPNDLLVWALCYIMEFYADFQRNQEKAVTITETIVTSIISCARDCDVEFLPRELANLGERILYTSSSIHGEGEDSDVNVIPKFPSDGFTHNFWHLMHAVSSIERQLSENLQGILWSQIFGKMIKHEKLWSDAFSIDGRVLGSGFKDLSTEGSNLLAFELENSNLIDKSSKSAVLRFVIIRLYRTLKIYKNYSYYPAVYTFCNILPFFREVIQQDILLNCVVRLKKRTLRDSSHFRLPLISYKFSATASKILQNPSEEKTTQFLMNVLKRCSVKQLGEEILAGLDKRPYGHAKSNFYSLIKFYKSMIKFFPTSEALKEIDSKSVSLFQEFTTLEYVASGITSDSYLNAVEAERFTRFLIKYGTISTCELAIPLLSHLMKHFVMRVRYADLLDLGISIAGIDKSQAVRPSVLENVLQTIKSCFQSLCEDKEKFDEIRHVFAYSENKVRWDFSKGSRREWFNSLSVILENAEIPLPVLGYEEESEGLSSEFEDEYEDYLS